MPPTLFSGNQHQDARGKISFINDCDLSKIKRFYVIKPADTEVVRAWQGHQQEEKWFYVVEGSFWRRRTADAGVETT